MSERSHLENEIIPFVTKRTYRLVKELGQGACGKTVLLHDELIDEHYVCKKYAPILEERRVELFTAFVREIKLLYHVHHDNVVRVYNHYLYPDIRAGFILMEYIEGQTIDEYVSGAPEKINELFQQAVAGFAYLQRTGILHRDIRLPNLMVRRDGRLKIIDLGFGKRIETGEDFDKSITLNWWCPTPNEFQESRYDFTTEVYFVGKLFESLIKENNIQHFKDTSVLGRMCQPDPANRIASFVDVETEIRGTRLQSLDFDDSEISRYRRFADAMTRQITKLESNAEYVDDVQQIQTQLNDSYRSVMLETIVLNSPLIIRCFVRGSYFYSTSPSIQVSTVLDFLNLLQSMTLEKKRIVLANLHTRLNALPRFSNETDEDIPF